MQYNKGAVYIDWKCPDKAIVSFKFDCEIERAIVFLQLEFFEGSVDVDSRSVVPFSLFEFVPRIKQTFH